MIITINIPEYIDNNIKKDFGKHIKSLCYLLSDNEIKVTIID